MVEFTLPMLGTFDLAVIIAPLAAVRPLLVFMVWIGAVRSYVGLLHFALTGIKGVAVIEGGE